MDDAILRRDDQDVESKTALLPREQAHADSEDDVARMVAIQAAERVLAILLVTAYGPENPLVARTQAVYSALKLLHAQLSYQASLDCTPLEG